MDRGKGIDTRNSSELLGANTRNVNSRKMPAVNLTSTKGVSGNAVSANIDRLDHISKSLQNEFYRLLNCDAKVRASPVDFHADLLGIRESSGSLNASNSYTSLSQNVLNGAHGYAKAFSEEALHSAFFYEEPVFKRLFENNLAAEYLECNGAIVMCNRRFGDLLGTTENKITGKPAIHLLGLDDSTLNYSRPENRSSRDSEQAEFVLKLDTGHGDFRWLNCSITRFAWDTFRMAFGSIIDISEQVHHSQSLKAANEKIRKLSLQLIGAQEVERKRVALELHDGISQSLSAIKLNIEQYIAVMNKPQSAESGVSDETTGMGNRLVRNMQSTIEEIRRIAVDLSPSMLDDLGVVQTIQWFCREFQCVHRRIKINKNVTIDEENVPDPLKIVIYRIVQESLNNASKHSNATQVNVEISVVTKGLRLCVRDNGDGFKEKIRKPANPHKGGMGLRSMQERAQSTGALFKVRSVSGEGVSVHVLWPHLQVERLRRQAVIDDVGSKSGYAV